MEFSQVSKKLRQLRKEARWEDSLSEIAVAKVKFPEEKVRLLGFEFEVAIGRGDLDKASALLQELPNSDRAYQSFQKKLHSLKTNPEERILKQRFAAWHEDRGWTKTKKVWPLVLRAYQLDPSNTMYESYIKQVGLNYIMLHLSAGNVLKANEIFACLPVTQLNRNVYSVARNLIAQGNAQAASPLLISLLHNGEKPPSELVILSLTAVDNTNRILSQIWSGVSAHYSEEEFREFRQKAYEITKNPLLALTDDFNLYGCGSGKIFTHAEFSIHGAIDSKTMSVVGDPRLHRRIDE